MAVNVSKTKYIIFKPKGKKVELNDNEGIFFNNNDVGGVVDQSKVYKLDRIFDNNPNVQDRSYKLLGVLLDENMSFNQHCKLVCNKIAQSNYILAKSKNLLPRRILRGLYFALVHPHLLYCLPIISCTTAANIKKLYTLQKKAIRSVCNVNYRHHTLDLFSELKVMPLPELIKFNKSLLTHSIVYNYGPKIFENQWVTNADRHPNIELRNAQDLHIPAINSEQVRRLPLIDFAVNWNNLSATKYHRNPALFKNLLREEIFRELQQ
jgi:hypothetical protein